MKNSFLKLKNVIVLNEQEQKTINGAGGCCDKNSAFGIAFPRICQNFPECQVQ